MTAPRATVNVHRRPSPPDYSILVVSLALVVVGLVFVYSASFAVALAEFGNTDYFLIRQTLSAAIGLVAMLVMMRFDYRRLSGLSPLLMLGTVVLLALVLFIGDDANGSRRWIPLGPFPAFQPSEFAKLAMIIYISAWLASSRRDLKSLGSGFAPFIFAVGVVAGLIMLEPDTGTTFIVVTTTAALFFLAGASIPHILTLAASGVVAFSLLILGGGYRSDRIEAFLAAEEDPGGVGFHILQLLIAFGSGGLEGLGLGVSRQKFFYVYGAHTDGVFAIIGEETGFIGAVLVLSLFTYLVYRGFKVALNARDDFGCYLAMGVVCWIAFQAIVNIGGITRSIPLTGIPLPFISYGGSSLIMTMAAVGVLLNVSRYGRDKQFTERPDRRKLRARAAAET